MTTLTISHDWERVEVVRVHPSAIQAQWTLEDERKALDTVPLLRHAEFRHSPTCHLCATVAGNE